MIINQPQFVKGSSRSLLSDLAPSGATAVTMPRWMVTGNGSAPVSGTPIVRAIEIPIGTVLNTLNVVSVQAEVGGTHAWGGILDRNLVLQAVSPDNTGSAFFAGSGSTQTFSLGGTYTTPYDGIYYCLVVAVFSTTGPTFAGPSMTTGISALTPVYNGTSGSGFTTPVTTGTQFAAIAGSGGTNFYAWTT